jgi:hypothetical protein
VGATAVLLEADALARHVHPGHGERLPRERANRANHGRSSGPTITTNVSTVSKGGTGDRQLERVSGPIPKDWIGLYTPGAANTAYLSWKYDSSCTQTAGSTAKASGSCSFTMPTTAGTFEFRLLANDGFTVIAKSGTISVA